ncbi:MAG: DUF1674 domain-containing protein [Alphaproteobacteria bacterium]|nr:DUF1674 domain-containing protein [Alphaproteobacteria bacterium]
MDPVSDAPAPKPISPAAERALAEAAERRAAAERAGRDEKNQPSEVGGRNGPEPTRYGDWEKGGITSDF